ncbi:peptide deformylase [Streptomyces lunaelactis]|uniref:peptide deformylase n=4 Tax=Streptomyces lunaelactis TaxID=1535768 RepID=UPI001584B357|nr:peptide deformylase [Streptomyces lunaelactis]NUK21899.1 peptide deformylase [Streptomyces lunaelactis]NUK32992.1 peptide deformylase [Streptomyces lunaelactis]NUK40395.1 peptide deformylase [Streptomyces lunaelactis]NUL29203.1 peptide deformylase [Streptomyces lunaelactis]
MRNRPIPGSSGLVRAMSLLGDPVLHAPCETVTDFSGGLRTLIEDMFATMYAAEGVGLAANQVGVPLRVFVYDCPDDEDVRHLGHIVNPRLVEADGVTVRGAEGCLSLPGLEAGTERFDHAVVEGVTAEGEPVRVEGTGFFARCLQHECDHLEGRVYTDRLRGWRRARAGWSVRRADWGTSASPAIEARGPGRSPSKGGAKSSPVGD